MESGLVVTVMVLLAILFCTAFSKKAGLRYVAVLAGFVAGFSLPLMIMPKNTGLEGLLPIGISTLMGTLAGLWLGIRATRRINGVPPRWVRALLIALGCLGLLALAVVQNSLRVADSLVNNGFYRTAGIFARMGILSHEEQENALLQKAPEALRPWLLRNLLAGREHALDPIGGDFQSYRSLLLGLHTAGQSDLLRQALLFLQEHSPESRQELFYLLAPYHTYADEDLFFAMLLAHGLSPDMRDKHGYPALLHAIYQRAWPLAERLLTAGANTNLTDKQGRSSLIAAIDRENTDFAKRLLAAGANPDMRDSNGYSPLSWAVFMDNAAMAEALIAAGADATIRVLTQEPPGESGLFHNMFGANLLHLAALAQAWECVPVLRRAGLDPNETDKQGMRPLLFAAYKGGAPVIELLAARGLSAQTADQQGLSPLHFGNLAAEDQDLPVPYLVFRKRDRDLPQDHATMVAALLDIGADVSARDAQGRTAMHYAAAGIRDYPPDFEAVKALLNAGARPDQQDKQGRTAAQLVRERKLHQSREQIMLRLFEQARP